ncbi:MAG: UDP-N-acetylmuramate--L-alanine ligase [Chlamydiia bacterium]|nr:UDP-N-acetylmuramate--L-alanine ligase [Chlamydiia bacterium]
MNYHFIGIGGIGMSGLARILLQKGHAVSGSDLGRTPLIAELESLGATIYPTHDAANITEPCTVVYSSSISETNPEICAAKEWHCPLYHRSVLLAELVNSNQGLVVAGTHGKTTTSALLAATLIDAACDPTWVVGGIVAPYGKNSSGGVGPHVVAEGDESDGTLVQYQPHAAIVTNIGLDHLDHYKTEDNLLNTFQTFIHQVKGEVFWCGDDQRLKSLTPPGTSYGFNANNTLRIAHIRPSGWQTQFDLITHQKTYSNIILNMIGEHNVLNAAAVFGLALSLNISESSIRHTFATFQGVGRRQEHIPYRDGVTLLDDYAHHPTEILATLRAVRQAIGERKLIALYQPHRYSRMETLLGTLSTCFSSADEVIVTEIFAAGEQPRPGVTSEKVYQEIAQTHPCCSYVPRNELLTALKLHDGDCLITLGAGDITKVCRNLP